VSAGRQILTLETDMWPIRALIFSPDGNALVAAGGVGEDPSRRSKLLIWRADPDQAARPLMKD